MFRKEKNKYGGVCDVQHTNKRIYRLWYQMLRRCYDKNQLERDKGKGYLGCAVCDEWFYYSNFEKDIQTLPGYEDWLNKKGYCLDKDTINPESRIYSKETCCFISSKKNISDVYKRHPENIEKLREANKTRYMLTKGDEVLIFNSETEACEYLGIARCSVASSYRYGAKCREYTITKMDGGTK